MNDTQDRLPNGLGDSPNTPKSSALGFWLGTGIISVLVGIAGAQLPPSAIGSIGINLSPVATGLLSASIVLTAISVIVIFIQGRTSPKDGYNSPRRANLDITLAGAVERALSDGSVADDDITDWHYVHNGLTQGPISEKQLAQLISEGEISSRTLVWKVGMSEWLPIQHTNAAKGKAFGAPPPVPKSITTTWMPRLVALFGISVLVLTSVFQLVRTQTPPTAQQRKVDSLGLKVSRHGALTHSDRNVINILNVGSTQITVANVTINDRPECYVKESPYGFPPQLPKALKVGDGVLIVGRCRIIRATIFTNLGARVYSFD